MSSGPNPIAVGFSVARSLLSVSRPGPFGEESADHSLLSNALKRVESSGPAALADLDSELELYLDQAATVIPRSLSRPEALAYWLNLYNAGALLLAGRAQREGADSILRIPGGFRHDFVLVDGESLSLDDIEHAKLRRFGDPRIHAALVCGSVSCPTLRGEPYSGDRLHHQLDDQLQHFLAAGAIETDEARGVVYLSRVFLWFGADFVKPHRMPTLLPVRKSRVLRALKPWVDPTTWAWVERATPTIGFQSYDWGLQCSVR